MLGLQACRNVGKKSKQAMQTLLFLYLIRVEHVGDELHLVRGQREVRGGGVSVSLAAEAVWYMGKLGSVGKKLVP